MTATQATTRTLDGAAIQAFREQLRGPLLTTGDPGYDDTRKVWNGMIDRRPGLIARCTGTADVAAAVNLARDHNVAPLAVRGGGHNVAGNAGCDGGLVIDLSLMRGIHVDPARGSAHAQGGVTWAELDRETQLHGLMTPGGVVSPTGIAGFTLAGGMGLTRRKLGLACDNLLSAEVVTADGSVLTASESEHPDLFWAIRGGGGNFGIVTSFEFKLHPLGPEVYLAAPFYALSDAPQVVRGWRAFIEQAPDEITADLVFWSMPAFPDLPAELVGAPIVIIAGLYAGPADVGERMLQPLREFATPLVDLSHADPYVSHQSAFDPFFPDTQRYYWKSIFADHLTDDVIDATIALAAEIPSTETLFALRGLGGAMGRVPEDATAYSNRAANYNLSLDTTWQSPDDDARMIAWTRDAWSRVHALTGGVYLNFAGLGEENDTLAHTGYGSNYDRLQHVKRRYDPTNLFRTNVNIKP